MKKMRTNNEPIHTESVGLFEPQPNSVNSESIWDRANKLRKYILGECSKSGSNDAIISEEQLELLRLRKEFKKPKGKTQKTLLEYLKVGMLDDTISIYTKL